MQKAEPQHNQTQNQPAQRQGGSAALESPQSERIAQLEAMAEASPQAGKLAQLAAMANDNPRMAAQRKAISAIHNSPYLTAQRQQLDSLTGETAQREEAEEPLQPKVAQREAAPAKPNNTGLPDNLKNGIESLSGMSMDSVRVHYNSSQPAQLNALAYAQGTDIHVAPGQEQHLPHEAWHVVQQAQGRVKPTMQMKGGVPVNDDEGLEREADVMGAKAISVGVVQGMSNESSLIDRQVSSLPTEGQWGINQLKAFQFRHVTPKINGEDLEYEGKAHINDDTAPARISKYSYEYVVDATHPIFTSRETALADSARKYAEVGTSMQGAPSFISRNTLKSWATGNAANAPAVYDVFKLHGEAPAEVPSGVATLNKRMQDYYNAEPRKSLFNNRGVLGWFQDNADIDLKDPVFVEVNIPWQSAAMAVPANIRSTISYTETYRGYVYKLVDTDLHVDAHLERRPVHTAAANSTTAIGTFSSTHHLDGNAPARDEIALAGAPNTHYQQERGVDTMTKVIAEGGRFDCVSAMGLNIRNTTRFYAEGPADDGYDRVLRYIRFKDLYRVWANHFQSRYRIPDSDVAEFLLANTDMQEVHHAELNSMTGDDHNLDE